MTGDCFFLCSCVHNIVQLKMVWWHNPIQSLFLLTVTEVKQWHTTPMGGILTLPVTPRTHKPTLFLSLSLSLCLFSAPARRSLRPLLKGRWFISLLIKGLWFLEFYKKNLGALLYYSTKQPLPPRAGPLAGCRWRGHCGPFSPFSLSLDLSRTS